MGNNNKSIKSKANAAAIAWANLAKDDSFAGMTLQQFTQAVAAVDAQQVVLDNLNAQYTGAAKQNDALHEGLNATTQAVVNGVRADLTKHGPDSPLYKAMGYVPASERATGLTRKAATSGTTTGTSNGPANPPANPPASEPVVKVLE